MCALLWLTFVCVYVLMFLCVYMCMCFDFVCLYVSMSGLSCTYVWILLVCPRFLLVVYMCVCCLLKCSIVLDFVLFVNVIDYVFDLFNCNVVIDLYCEVNVSCLLLCLYVCVCVIVRLIDCVSVCSVPTYVTIFGIGPSVDYVMGV